MLLRETFATTPLDRQSLPQSNLNIDKRVRTNPFPWTGQFSPQLVEELLRAFAPDTGVVLDPFVGSGTLLAEAVRVRLAACGCDVNPAAVILAHTYQLTHLNASKRVTLLEDLGARLYDKIGSPQGPLFADEPFRLVDRARLKQHSLIFGVNHHRALRRFWRRLSWFFVTSTAKIWTRTESMRCGGALIR